MALQMKLEMDTGVVLPEAYVRITEGILSLDRGITFITVQTYADANARNLRKVPVLIHEVACTMDGAKPKKDAKYTIKLNNADVGSALEFSIDLTGDGVEDIELIEGTHVTTDGTLGTYTQAIVDRLNADVDFMYDFVASSTLEGEIIVFPLQDGTKTGGKGNGVKFYGTAVKEVIVEEGNDRVIANFEKYFGIESMNEAGTNAIMKAYEFIKTLPEYQGSIDV
jgi:hypothetical protein